MATSYLFSAAARYPLQARAFAFANEILNSRDGAGFTFRVRTKSGETLEGPPASTAAIEVDNEGILTLELGGVDVVYIDGASIESITVVEC